MGTQLQKAYDDAEELRAMFLKIHRASMKTVSEQVVNFINNGMEEKQELAQMFLNMADAMTDLTLKEAAALIHSREIEARINENEKTLYFLEDTELSPEMIVKALTKDRTARRRQLQKLKEQTEGEGV